MSANKTSVKLLILLHTVWCLSMPGCKTKDNLISYPVDDYLSDSFFFRAVGYGEDIDMQRAKTKAIYHAKVEIGRLANSVCRQVALHYVEQIGNNNTIAFQDRFMSVSTESVSESLSHVMIEEVAFAKDKNNQYTCFAKVKVRKDHILDTFSAYAREKMNVDAELFIETVEEVVNGHKTKE